ncbi:MAG TPA: molybdopterin dinucleotide binding domain-containing protein, partial [Blastocatellia bacterium]
IARESLGKVPHRNNSLPLDDYSPEKTESETGIPAERIIRVAREFASSQPALAIGSGTALIEHQADIEASLKRIEAIHLLNKIAVNEDKAGGVLLPPPRIDPLAKWRGSKRWLPLTARAINGLSALFIHRANPVFTIPYTADAINSIPFIVSFSSFPDETSQIADLLLPDHTWLEGWNISATRAVESGSVVNLTQPVISPQLDTKQTADVLLALARSLGSSPQFENAEETVRQAASGIAHNAGAKDEEVWSLFTERGMWTIKPQSNKQTARQVASSHAPSTNEAIDELASLARQVNAAEFPFLLLTYDHPSLGFGEQANLPSLQELPDPMTGVIWGSWVEINPQTASRLGLTDGDLIEVETPHGSLKAPALIYPAIRPEVIAMPFGQGHTASGRYAEKRGANPAAVNPLAAAVQSGAIAVRAKITKLSEQAGHIRFGTNLPERPHIKR